MPEFVAFPGIDPVVPMAFMQTAEPLSFVMNFLPSHPTWKEMRQVVINELDGLLESLFDVLLGDFNKLTDQQVEFVLYVDPTEVNKALHYIEHRQAR